MEISVGGKKLNFFNGFSLSLRYDAVASSFAFDAYFNPENETHKELLKPLQYQDCIVTHNGEKVITGTILSQTFPAESEPKLVQINGYSKTGVIEDSTIPTSIYPLQSNGLTLRQIASKLLNPFNLSFVVSSDVSSDMDKVFTVSTAGERQTVKDYLSELATQRNIVITHNEKGQLLFTRANTTQNPILTIDGGAIPATKMTLNINGQAMHSTITVVKQADIDGGNAGQSTVNNPYVSVFRPIVKTQDSGNDTDTSKAAKAALALELKAITLTIDIDRWDANNSIIRPGAIIAIKEPKLYIYNLTRFFVEQIDYAGNSESMTANLKCVLLEVYNGKTPINIFN